MGAPRPPFLLPRLSELIQTAREAALPGGVLSLLPGSFLLIIPGCRVPASPPSRRASKVFVPECGQPGASWPGSLPPPPCWGYPAMAPTLDNPGAGRSRGTASGPGPRCTLSVIHSPRLLSYLQATPSSRMGPGALLTWHPGRRRCPLCPLLGWKPHLCIEDIALATVTCGSLCVHPLHPDQTAPERRDCLLCVPTAHPSDWDAVGT